MARIQAGGAFRGALVTLAANQTGADYSTITAIPLDAEIYDTNGFHDNVTNNTRLTVPAGLGITRVRVSYGVFISNLDSVDFARTVVIKNGVVAFVEGLPYQSNDISEPSGQVRQSAYGAVVEVSDGDYFEITLDIEGGTPDTSIDVLATHTWFAIEVVE